MYANTPYNSSDVAYAAGAALGVANDYLSILPQANSPAGPDSQARFSLYDTFTGASVKFEKKVTANSAWTPLQGVVRLDTFAAVSGTITLADSTGIEFLLPSIAGLYAVRMVLVGIGTGGVKAEVLTFAGGRAGVVPVATTVASTPQTITSNSATALAVGPNGTTNPTLQVDASTASAATGLKVKGAAAGGGMALSVVSSGGAESLTIDAKGTGTITIGATSTGNIVLGTTGHTITLNNTTGAVTMDAGGLTMTAGNLLLSAGTATVTSANASALAVGRQGATNPVLKVDASTATVLTGLQIKGAGTGAGCALSVIEAGGTNNKLTIDAMGSGTTEIGSTSTGQVYLGRGSVKQPMLAMTKTDINTQNIAPTMAQLLGGYITHNSQTGAGTFTTPTGANIDAGLALAGVTGDTFLVYYNNRGNQTVTLTAGDGAVTLRGTVAIPTLKSAVLLFNRTGAGTWDVNQTLSA